MSDLGIAHTLDSECINMLSDKDIVIFAANDRSAHIIQNDTENIDGKKECTVKLTSTTKVTGAVKETFEDTQTTDVKNAIAITSQTAHIYIHGSTSIQLHVGESKLWMASDGTISLEGVNITIKGKKIVVIGDEEIKESAPKVDISGGTEAKFGVGNQNVACDKAQTAIAGAAINSSAKGKHEITGAVVKIN